MLARLGGDEFAILLPGSDAASARSVARSVIAAVRAHEIAVGSRRVRLTASGGGALYEPGAADRYDLLAAANAAMYEAKQAGRDRNVVYSPAEGVRARASSGKSWEHRIIDALDGDGFELYCQPILHLGKRSVSRYALLLRMRIADDIARAGVDPSRLVFEITETAMIANMDDARRFAESLAALGCRFAIDDFGVGFGSFSYLKHLPVSFLKIDGEFVRSPRSRTDDLVIEAIVGMARGLGKATIAEFVGDDETVEMLAAAGVDYARGYHLGAPFPARELAT